MSPTTYFISVPLSCGGDALRSRDARAPRPYPPPFRNRDSGIVPIPTGRSRGSKLLSPARIARPISPRECLQRSRSVPPGGARAQGLGEVSVARTISPASGMTASPEARKIQSAAAWDSSTQTASGNAAAANGAAPSQLYARPFPCLPAKKLRRQYLVTRGSLRFMLPPAQLSIRSWRIPVLSSDYFELWFRARIL
jgi:hypothetical protein